MPIPLHCSCGKAFQVLEQYAGKRIRCPACQAVLAVPAPAAEAEEVVEVEEAPDAAQGYSVTQVRKCPKCGHEWPPKTVICIDCGYDFEAGRKLKTTYKLRPHFTDTGWPAVGCYTRFAVSREKKGRPCLTVKSWFLWLPMGIKVIDLSDYDAVATDYALANDGNGHSYDRYFLELQRRGGKSFRVWTGTSESTMQAIIDVLKEGGGLAITRK
jgi:hypothetical protein